jgi:hypothetical protein
MLLVFAAVALHYHCDIFVCLENPYSKTRTCASNPSITVVGSSRADEHARSNSLATASVLSSCCGNTWPMLQTSDWEHRVVLSRATTATITARPIPIPFQRFDRCVGLAPIRRDKRIERHRRELDIRPDPVFSWEDPIPKWRCEAKSPNRHRPRVGGNHRVRATRFGPTTSTLRGDCFF